MTAERIAQTGLLDQVHLAPEEPPQVFLHRHQVEQAPRCARREGHENVEVAVRPEIVAQHRPEEGELRDLPAPAEVGKRSVIDRDAGAHRVNIPAPGPKILVVPGGVLRVVLVLVVLVLIGGAPSARKHPGKGRNPTTVM